MTLTIAFNYGGRIEIADAVKRMPDPGLIIRTSGEQRLSNFLLWQAAYSELWFTPVFWPDFSREHLYEAIRDYQKRSRRFGGLAED